MAEIEVERTIRIPASFYMSVLAAARAMQQDSGLWEWDSARHCICIEYKKDTNEVVFTMTNGYILKRYTIISEVKNPSNFKFMLPILPYVKIPESTMVTLVCPEESGGRIKISFTRGSLNMVMETAEVSLSKPADFEALFENPVSFPPQQTSTLTYDVSLLKTAFVGIPSKTSLKYTVAPGETFYSSMEGEAKFTYRLSQPYLRNVGTRTLRAKVKVLIFGMREFSTRF